VTSTILIAHPSAELYGSDRVALESAIGLLARGHAVHVSLTADGPLGSALRARGASVSVDPAPVLRKAFLSPLGLLRLGVQTVRYTPRMWRLLRSTRPDVVYVSTVTVPWWLVLARVNRSRVIAHVHEAEELPRALGAALASPLLLAHQVIANSKVSRDILLHDLPPLRARTRVLYNGVAGPERTDPPREELSGPVRLALVGRISARKGTDVAVDAVRLLRERGIDATLDLIGGIFPGYEWFEDEVRAAVQSAGLQDQVHWRGILPDIWSALAQADIALVPSRVEPFGNAAVEAMLAGRPVVACDTQGLREIVRAGQNGELAAPGDAAALADAVCRVIKDWPASRRRAEAAQREAVERFSVERYRDDIAGLTERG
jgi:glycosyltransferase involved in cell wall biosynthesis